MMGMQTRLMIAFVIGLTTMIIWYIGFNAASADRWNNGTCPDCGEQYELRAVTRDYRKYYSCPVCGEEVARY